MKPDTASVADPPINIGTIDMSNASVELPPDDPPPLSPESRMIAELTARNERMAHQISMLTEPPAENWQRFKNAAIDSGTARETLRRRVKSGEVKSRTDPHGNLEVEVNDAKRVRWEQAALGG